MHANFVVFDVESDIVPQLGGQKILLQRIFLFIVEERLDRCVQHLGADPHVQAVLGKFAAMIQSGSSSNILELARMLSEMIVQLHTIKELH